MLAGTLYVIATPIGNLEDITLRAVRILREEVAVIACEDTRQTRKLLDHYGIEKPLLSYHQHNETSRAQEILASLERGDSVALVSDAGTPLISDPGYRAVKEAINGGFRVVPVPGPSALMAALAGSGLPCEEFRFIGFLPSKPGPRRKALTELQNERATIVAYETPHRIVDTLAEIAGILGSGPVVLAREVTKVYEEFLRGSAETIREELVRRGSIKGEITLVIGRPEVKRTAVSDSVSEVVRLETEAGLERMEAIKAVATQLGVPKREIYRRFAQADSNRRHKHQN